MWSEGDELVFIHSSQVSEILTEITYWKAWIEVLFTLPDGPTMITQ